jgi:hypothetical protein
MKELSLSPLEILAVIEHTKLRHFVELVANGPRPDGTYNRCRAALEVEAKRILKELKEIRDEIDQ